MSIFRFLRRRRAAICDHPEAKPVVIDLITGRTKFHCHGCRSKWWTEHDDPEPRPLVAGSRYHPNRRRDRVVGLLSREA